MNSQAPGDIEAVREAIHQLLGAHEHATEVLAGSDFHSTLLDRQLTRVGAILVDASDELLINAGATDG